MASLDYLYVDTFLPLFLAAAIAPAALISFFITCYLGIKMIELEILPRLLRVSIFTLIWYFLASVIAVAGLLVTFTIFPPSPPVSFERIIYLLCFALISYAFYPLLPIFYSVLISVAAGPVDADVLSFILMFFLFITPAFLAAVVLMIPRTRNFINRKIPVLKHD